MTNEELAARLTAGDESALDELCKNNTGLIRACARKMLGQYNCIRYEPETTRWSSYTTTMLDDLCGAGMLAFIECLRSGEYDSGKGALTTFVVPYITGAMRRHLESSLGNLALNRNDMTMLRRAQMLYNTMHKTVSEIAEMLEISEKRVTRYLEHNTHFYGIEDALQSAYDDNDSDPAAILEDRATKTPAQIVYRSMRIEYLRELFDALPQMEKDILGKFYGVFGCREESLHDIAMYHMITADAVEKAKDRGLDKLLEAYSGSKLQWWNRIHRLMEYPELPEDDREIVMDFPQYVRALAEVYGILYIMEG